ncbi:MAG: hypothetical protein ACYC3X_16390 [Pirellulaceae bacterium]
MKTLLTACVLCVLVHAGLRAEDAVPPQRMRAVYEEVQTPYKFGVVIRDEAGKPVDCPSVFRQGERWYMVYICMNEVGYEKVV